MASCISSTPASISSSERSPMGSPTAAKLARMPSNASLPIGARADPRGRRNLRTASPILPRRPATHLVRSDRGAGHPVGCPSLLEANALMAKPTGVVVQATSPRPPRRATLSDEPARTVATARPPWPACNVTRGALSRSLRPTSPATVIRPPARAAGRETAALGQQRRVCCCRPQTRLVADLGVPGERCVAPICYPGLEPRGSGLGGVGLGWLGSARGRVNPYLQPLPPILRPTHPPNPTLQLSLEPTSPERSLVAGVRRPLAARATNLSSSSRTRHPAPDAPTPRGLAERLLHSPHAEGGIQGADRRSAARFPPVVLAGFRYRRGKQSQCPRGGRAFLARSRHPG